MRLNCDIEVVSRLVPSINIKGRRRPVRSTLALCPKLGATKDACNIHLVLCTGQNPSGRRYKVLGNVEQVFTKFAGEGKATICFKDPKHDIVIKRADPVQLKGFLHILHLVLQNMNLDQIHLSQPPAHIERPKMRMSVNRRQDYPTKAIFPPSLQHLCINHCNLCRFDSRILKLQHLRVLDLSDNVLQAIPAGLGQLCQLQELILSNNKLEEIPAQLFKGGVKGSLDTLILCQNQLRTLPREICELERLKTLAVSHNKLSCLPQNIGHLSVLRRLNLSYNELQVLPLSLTKLRLDLIDLSCNSFEDVCLSEMQRTFQLPTLLEISACSVVQHRIPYQSEDLPRSLVPVLESVRWCPCGHPASGSCGRLITRISVKAISQSVVTVASGGCLIPLEVYPCSPRCWAKCSKGIMAV